MKSLLLATALVSFPALAMAGSHGDKPAPVTVKMTGADGADHGTVTLTQLESVVLLHADLKGVPEGAHGFGGLVPPEHHEIRRLRHLRIGGP